MANSQFRIYRNTDTSAPQLDGTTGSLVRVLDAVLVTGYGSQPSAGWSLELTSSINSGSCYRPPSGSRMYLSVRDDATTGSRNANIVGMESPITFNTGSGMFPINAQNATFLWQRKSSTADGSSKPWICFADAYTMYFFAYTGDTTNVYYSMVFGDIYSLKPSDAYNCIIIGSNANNATAGANNQQDTQTIVTTALAGIYMPRSFTQGGISINVGRHANYALGGGLFYGVNVGVNPANNAMYMSPIWVHETSPTVKRGRMRGMYHICAPLATLAEGQQFSGSNAYAGKVFQVVKQGVNGGFWGMEISNTVETN